MSAKPSDAKGLKDYFTKDHRECDSEWAALEAAADAGDTAQVEQCWAEFERCMQRHFEMEESVLFPAIEEATGMMGGPTFVMRSEHQQMRGVMEQMAAAVRSGDISELLGHGDTLLMLIQQHNVKEENILYPMGENALAAGWDEMAKKLENDF